MTNLSPATSAILDAYWETFNAPLEGAIHRPLAAALRAAAGQVVPEVWFESDDITEARDALLAIAAELENQ
jgi:hypothetical protein